MNICLDESIARLRVLFLCDKVMRDEVGLCSSESMQRHFAYVHDKSAWADIYRQNNFDVVMIDSDFPHYREIIEEIFYHNINQRIIVTSLCADNTHLIMSMQLGVSMYMQRPLNAREFYIALSQIAFNVEKIHPRVMLHALEGSESICGRLFLDIAREQVFEDCNFSKLIHLSPKLKKLFWLMYDNINNVVTYDRLICHVYNNEEINYNTLRMAIVRLKKLCGISVQNMSGEGYMLACNRTYL